MHVSMADTAKASHDKIPFFRVHPREDAEGSTRQLAEQAAVGPGVLSGRSASPHVPWGRLVTSLTCQWASHSFSCSPSPGSLKLHQAL